MYDLLVSILVWLSADPAQINTVAPRAASCSSAAYATMVRQELTDEEQEPEPEVEDSAGGGDSPAPKPLKRVVRCRNGRCYITYE
jgi:hypothetical protein